MTAPDDDISWHTKAFRDLTLDELYGLLKLRSEVFVVEQKCVFLDIDSLDQVSHHVYAKQASTANQIVACTRIFDVDAVYEGGYTTIGRVCTHPTTRGQGIGRELMIRSVAEIERVFGKHPIKIGAQLYLNKFYCSFGFAQCGPMYLEDDIEHIPMIRPAQTETGTGTTTE